MTDAQSIHDRTEAVRYRPHCFPQRNTLVDQRDDGTVLMRCADTLNLISQASPVEFIAHWAAERSEAAAFRERDPEGGWRSITWGELWRQIQAVGAGLLELGLGHDRPLMLLSGNSIEQVVLLLAAEYAGVPTAPVSPAYSTLSRDFAQLRDVAQLFPPAALFVQDAAPFARAIATIGQPGIPVITVRGGDTACVSWANLAATSLSPERLSALECARAALRPDDTVRVLFTSGSTGNPKGVRFTYANFRAVASYYLDAFVSLRELQPVFLDWLPWHHALGGIVNVVRSIALGGTYHLDDGRPLPGQYDRTVRNLREVSPTLLTSVPAAWSMLVAEIERDPELARSVFANAVVFTYGGASLPRDIWDRLDRVAEKTVGERIGMFSGLGSTETCGMGVYCVWPTNEPGNLGVPMPSAEVKLVPLEGGDGRFEMRVRGPFLFAGYVQRDDLTAAAFDEEGYFRLGDAVRLVDPADPARGLRFAGRVVEDFKLANGTWVRTGAVRLSLVEQCAPLISDAVICGHDGDYLAALAWPNFDACRKLHPELARLDAEALVRHPVVVRSVAERLQGQRNSGASVRIHRVLLMAEPPSQDANEIADKAISTRPRRAPAAPPW
ncbi:AMP-binding protein [Cupriavidus taiwanensis]|uniref:AMP-dependent synthetase and ligase n=1 Tax=Cupriavidus taiwanensis TaxID=164546 RepID=A0A7Z7JF98_9BURK|nr:AMP-dependent synthetase and ligase [Cupriavidus taiwanensis]SOZ96222.1 AMP-dependent synthetase and ligase [Cupriavidus taiwanensis]SPC25509.1 AMP-dependent synthetase and ligase [Cupriavidus taiwanensis]